MNSAMLQWPRTIDWSAHCRAMAARFKERIAVRDAQDQTLSYGQLVNHALKLADALKARGARFGTPVASLLPNSLDAVWVSLGLKIGGFAEVALGWGTTADEIAWSTHVSGATWLLTVDRGFERAAHAGLQAIDIHSLQAAWNREPVDLHWSPADSVTSVPAETTGRIQFTSGTTGRPKGVLTTHARRWLGEQMQKACLPFAPQPGERILLMTPFVHGAGLLSAAWLDCGGEIILHDGVDPSRVHPLLDKGELAAMFAPPTVLAKLVAAFTDQELPGLRCIFTGTQPLAEGLYKRARKMFGPVVRITYGKTECINPITTLVFDEIDAAFAETPLSGASCTGWPAPGVELSIGQPGIPSTLPAGEDEVWCRAPQQSDGMLTLDGFQPHQPDGWHATGDLGFIDHRGRLWLTGRVADVIKTGGYRVNPDEIEAALAGMRCCLAVCVTAIPSDYWGDIIVAAIEGAQSGWQEEMSTRLQTLSRHKHPRLTIEWSDLPRNPQGKVSRRKLRELILERYTLRDGAYPALSPVDSNSSALGAP